MSDGITIDTREFKQTLREYKEVTKRDIATILNTKGFYIARGAVRATHRPTKEEIRRKLQEFVGATRLASKKVKLKSKANVTSWFTGQNATAPLLALIINKNRGAAGKKGLYGERMAKAVSGELNRRFRSIAFIASGFLSAVKGFEPLAERKGSAPARDPQVKQLGQAKGAAVTARPGWQARAVIINSASARGDHRGALEKFGGAALQTAFDIEVASMKTYIEGKMQETANKVNAKRK